MFVSNFLKYFKLSPISARYKSKNVAKEYKAVQKAAKAAEEVGLMVLQDRVLTNYYQAKKKAEKEAAKKAEKEEKAKASLFNTARRKKMRQGGETLERVTAQTPLNDPRYMKVDRGEEFDVISRFPDGTVSARRVSTGETGLVMADVFLAPDVLF